MFAYTGAPVPVRPDLRYSHISTWGHFSRPGPTLRGDQRIDLLDSARADSAERDAEGIGLSPTTGALADHLMHRPASVNETVVRRSAAADGDAAAVEVIGLVSMLSAVDFTHLGLGADLEPLPQPQPGPPTGVVAEGLKRRRTHIPVPPGPIPVVLDLVPDEGAAFQAMFGPHYMTGWEMALDGFARNPGLDRAQMELVSSRTSLHNECFY